MRVLKYCHWWKYVFDNWSGVFYPFLCDTFFCPFFNCTSSLRLVFLGVCERITWMSFYSWIVLHCVLNDTTINAMNPTVMGKLFLDFYSIHIFGPFYGPERIICKALLVKQNFLRTKWLELWKLLLPYRSLKGSHVLDVQENSKVQNYCLIHFVLS